MGARPKKLAERLCIQFTSIVLIKSNKPNEIGIISTSNRTNRQSKVSAAPLKGQTPFRLPWLRDAARAGTSPLRSTQDQAYKMREQR